MQYDVYETLALYSHHYSRLSSRTGPTSFPGWRKPANEVAGVGVVLLFSSISISFLLLGDFTAVAFESRDKIQIS